MRSLLLNASQMHIYLRYPPLVRADAFHENCMWHSHWFIAGYILIEAVKRCFFCFVYIYRQLNHRRSFALTRVVTYFLERSDRHSVYTVIFSKCYTIKLQHPILASMYIIL